MATRRRIYPNGRVMYKAVVKQGPVIPKEIILGEFATREEAIAAVTAYRRRKDIKLYVGGARERKSV